VERDGRLVEIAVIVHLASADAAATERTGSVKGNRAARNDPSEVPALLHKLNYTYAGYLGFEASSNVKHEFLGGQIYAMAGGTPEHAALAAAAITLLGPQLRGGVPA
jgi:hypothetical protein